MTSELANKATLKQIIDAWNQSVADVRQAHALLVGAEKRLHHEIKGDVYRFGILSRWEGRDFRNIEDLIADLQRNAWAVLIERMEIRRFLSIERSKELDKQIANGELPEITEENVMAMLGAGLNGLDQFMKESVQEVFEFLRPRKNATKNYKTNSEFDIGKRVIMKSWVKQQWNGQGYTHNLDYYREIMALDRVFHNLDGQGFPKTYYGPLRDAIDAAGKDGLGETKYFKFKCCKNGSFHLEFKDMALVDKFNQIAGGNRLYQPKETK